MGIASRTRLTVGAVAIGFLVAACGAPPEKVQPGDDSLKTSIPLEKDFDPTAEFKWAHSSGATSWDPVDSATGFDMPFLFPIYDRLVYAAPDGKMEPMLAESWEGSEDGKVLTLKLRPGLKFSDGEPFNATAVKINLDRALAPESKLRSYIHTITAVEAVDELTVKITVDGAMGALVAALSARPGMMASPKSIAAGTLQTAPVGIGPYTATEIVPGDSVSMVKTEGYWDPDAQRVAKMYFQQITDDQARLNGILSGEFDGGTVRQNQVEPAQKDGLNVITDVSPMLLYLNLNASVEPLDDPKVRMALNHAVDREGIGEGLWEGFCTPQAQPYPKTSYAYNKKIGDGLDTWDYNPEKAKKLLAEAGYPDGFDLEIVASNVSIYTSTAEAIQDQLAKIGVKVSVQPLPTVPLIEAFAIAKTAGGMVSPASSTVDPNFLMEQYILPEARFNPGGKLPADMVELARQASAPLEAEDRAPIYQKFAEKWMDNSPNVLPLCLMHSLMGFSPNVSGVSIYQTGVYDLRGVAVKKD